MRSLNTRVVSIVVLALSGTVSAQPWHSNEGLPQNQQPQTEERYQPRNQLADVQLDAWRDHAYIQLPQTGRRLDYLELRAGRARFALDDVEVLFADGTSIHTGDRGVVRPFQGRVIDLPHNAAPVIAIVAHYHRLSRWMAPELQVFGVPEHGHGGWHRPPY